MASSQLQTRTIRSHARARKTCQNQETTKPAYLPKLVVQTSAQDNQYKRATRSAGLSIRHSFAQKRFENHRSSKDFTVSPLLKHHLMERARMRSNENKQMDVFLLILGTLHYFAIRPQAQQIPAAPDGRSDFPKEPVSRAVTVGICRRKYASCESGFVGGRKNDRISRLCNKYDIVGHSMT